MRALRDQGKAGRRKAARPLPAVLRDAFSAQFSLFFLHLSLPASPSLNPLRFLAVPQEALHFIFPSESSHQSPRRAILAGSHSLLPLPEASNSARKALFLSSFPRPSPLPLLISKKLLCRKARMLFSPLPKDHYQIRGQHEDGARRGIFGFGRVISCLPWQQSITKIRSS